MNLVKLPNILLYWISTDYRLLVSVFLTLPLLAVSISSMKIVLIIMAYLIGSIPSGIIVARALGGIDPRSEGSGNIGATNVLRTLGKKAAVLTLVGDVLKGLLPVLLAKALLPAASPAVYLVALAAILGHDFSLFLGFRGGKGVATTVGTLVALSPHLAGLCLLTWLAVVAVTRFSSAGALVTAAISPVYALVLGGGSGLVLFCVAAALLLIVLHRENIKRLANGTEKRMEFKSKA